MGHLAGAARAEGGNPLVSPLIPAPGQHIPQARARFFGQVLAVLALVQPRQQPGQFFLRVAELH